MTDPANSSNVPVYLTAVNLLLRLSGLIFAAVAQENGNSGAALTGWTTCQTVITQWLRNKSTLLYPEQKARLVAGVWMSHLLAHQVQLSEATCINSCNCPAAVVWYELAPLLDKPALEAAAS